MKGVFNMSQDSVRERLKFYLLSTGTKQSFICDNIRMPKKIMSQFIHGKTDIYQSHLEILDSFLKENKY